MNRTTLLLHNHLLWVMAAFCLSAGTALLGYIMLGILPMLIFSVGFIGGFLLWIFVPSELSWSSIRIPYFLTLAFFILHKQEERYMDFFPALSKITGVPVPDVSSPLVILLYAAAAAWLFIPFFIARNHEFGYYLAWTFFTSMGVVELAHFIFPLFIEAPYGYFPGMVSVVILAPIAWWGLRLMYLGKNQSSLV